jgi:hypothetical protein
VEASAAAVRRRSLEEGREGKEEVLSNPKQMERYGEPAPQMNTWEGERPEKSVKSKSSLA